MMSAHLICLIFKFCGKEFSFPDPGHEEMIAFPEIEIKKLFIGDPFELTLRRIDQFAAELGGSKHKYIPVIAFEVWEYQQTAILWILNGQARLF